MADLGAGSGGPPPPPLIFRPNTDAPAAIIGYHVTVTEKGGGVSEVGRNEQTTEWRQSHWRHVNTRVASPRIKKLLNSVWEKKWIRDLVKKDLVLIYKRGSERSFFAPKPHGNAYYIRRLKWDWLHLIRFSLAFYYVHESWATGFVNQKSSNINIYTGHRQDDFRGDGRGLVIACRQEII